MPPSPSEAPSRRFGKVGRSAWLVALLCLAGVGAWALLKSDSAAPPPISESTRQKLNQDLLSAAEAGDADQVATLLRAGASANARDESEQTALMMVTTGGHAVVERVYQEAFGMKVVIEGLPAPPVTKAQIQSVELLIEHGADVGALNKDQMTAFLLAVGRDYAPIAERLLEEGANANATYPSGLPAASLAAKRGFTTTLEVLLDAGAKMDQATKTEKVPLHYAAEAGHTGAVRLLLDRGSAIDPETLSGWTPLHFAASLGHSEIVELLLARGADKSRLTKRGWSAARMARARGHDELAKRLTTATP